MENSPSKNEFRFENCLNTPFLPPNLSCLCSETGCSWLSEILGVSNRVKLADKTKEGKLLVKEHSALFSQVAQNLLNNVVLFVNQKPYRLVEIEIYYNDESSHPDLFTHNNALQQTWGHWYFHRSGNGCYKGGLWVS